MTKFKAKILKVGGSFGLIIPRAYIDNKQIVVGEIYIVELELNAE